MDSEKIKELTSELTAEEKIQMIHGAGFFNTAPVKRLGIPGIIMSDGPMGVRHEIRSDIWEDACETEDFVSYFPSNTAIAATWNPETARKIGKDLGCEARGRGKDVILAPGINIIRTPLCGRNFEYMSEDPQLISAMAVPMIQGIQENDAAACVKHFALNNQEENRMEVNADTDERALREIYLRGFEAAVKKGGVSAVMSAYNRFRGEYCSHSGYLLDEILRKEWGFDGAVISDWGAVHDTKAAAACGLDIEMSTDGDFEHYYLARPLLEAIKSGEVKQEDVDRKIEHILTFMNKIGLFKKDRKSGAYNLAEHRQHILSAAEESVVLLKNESVLPLNKEKLKKIAVIGENAQRLHAAGGGSAEIKALYEISPILGLKMVLGGNTEICYAKGYSSDSTQSEKLRGEAVRLAEECEAVIYFGGLNHDFDSEGFDKKDMKLPYEQDYLIKELLDVCPDTVIVMISGGPAEMGTWIGKAKAVVQSWYAGMEGGTALANILFGISEPSGRLPMTFPSVLGDSPVCAAGQCPGGLQQNSVCHASDLTVHIDGQCPEKISAHIADRCSDDLSVYYKEGIYTGYRYYDKYGVKPQFYFGHGLAYTEFDYESINAESFFEAEPPFIRVRTAVKNIGRRPGTETVQVYMHGHLENMEMPVKELKGFTKLYLEPGECCEAVIDIEARDCSSYDVNTKKFEMWRGEVKIMAAHSAGDIRKECSICFPLKKMKEEKGV